MRKIGDEGQALVEMALVLPVLALILLVTVEGGRLLLSKMTAERLARETAEMAGSVGAPTAEVWEYVSAQVDDLGSVLGQVRSVRLTVRSRSMDALCHGDYPAASSCQASYGDWVEVTVAVRVSTLLGDVDLETSHQAAAWRAFVP
jgi:uncharacterized membrane protein